MVKRRMNSSLLFVVFIFTFVGGNVVYSKKSPKLMFILLDGFRWNYLDKGNFPGFRKFYQNGVKADYTTVDFPSLSLPNYYSVLTGLHVESHGFIGNRFYDERTGRYFDLSNQTSWYTPDFWQGGEPIWIAAEKQGKRAYVYYWIGCEVEIRGKRPTFCAPYFYNSVEPKYPDTPFLSSAANEGLALFKNDSADLVVIYFEGTDDFGHVYGPESPEIVTKLTDVDKVISQLLKNITNQGLDDEVSVVIVSDHGMTEIAPERSINLTDAIDVTDLVVKTMDYGPTLKLWPKSDRIEKVYNDIKAKEAGIGHFKVYRKNELPDRWHYKNNYRIPPIMVVADPGWMILQPYRPEIQPYKGYHGYDPLTRDMHGIFMAKGPGLKQNIKLSSVHIVDVYNLMCHVLEIEPSPNNGTWSTFLPILAGSSGAVQIEISIVFALLLSILFSDMFDINA